MSHSTNARLYPNMQPHRWPWPGLWAAGFPKQMEGPAKCLGGFPALPEPVPGAGITDVPPRQQSQHMPLLERRWLGSDRTCTPRSTHQGISTVVLQGGLLEARLHPPPSPSPWPAWPILPPDPHCMPHTAHLISLQRSALFFSLSSLCLPAWIKSRAGHQVTSLWLALIPGGPGD